MAFRWVELLVFAVLGIMVAMGLGQDSSSSSSAAPAPVPALGPAPAPAPAPGSDSSCQDALISLTPCLDYITAPTDGDPGAGCCSALATVVKKEPSCLCQLLSGRVNVGVTVNDTRALELPSKCHVKTPPTSECAEEGFPIPPMMAPVPSPQSPSSSHPDVTAAATMVPVSVICVVTSFLFSSLIL